MFHDHRFGRWGRISRSVGHPQGESLPAATAAAPVECLIADYAKYPGAKVGPWSKTVQCSKGLHKRVLNDIVDLVVAAKNEVGNATGDVLVGADQIRIGSLISLLGRLDQQAFSQWTALHLLAHLSITPPAASSFRLEPDPPDRCRRSASRRREQTMAQFRLLIVMSVALLAIPAMAHAGGWALTSFDELPPEFQAGATYDLTYTVLQHGVNPVDVGQSEVRVTGADGEVTTFTASGLPEVGRYRVTVTFPESGIWTWEVFQGDFGTHPMGPISVAGAAATAPGASVLSWLLPLGLAITLGLVAVQVVGLARQRRLAHR